MHKFLLVRRLTEDLKSLAAAADGLPPWLMSQGPRGRGRRRGQGRGDGGVVFAVDVVMWRWGGLSAVELVAAAEVNTQAHMPLFAPLLATLTFLLLLVAAPRNPPLETLAFTLPSMALTPKTQRPPPSGLLSSPRTPTPAVPLAGLHQVGYEIFTAAATNASQRRPSGHPQRP